MSALQPSQVPPPATPSPPAARTHSPSLLLRRALARLVRAPLTWLLGRVPLRLLFEGMYMTAADPWDYHRSAFETERYRHVADLVAGVLPSQGEEASPLRVLELGCSVGAFTRLLVQRFPVHVTAVDISAAALQRVEQALVADGLTGRATTVRLDLFADDLPAGPYHLIVVSDVLGYTDDRGVLSSLAGRLEALLAPDGAILLGNTKLAEQDGEGWQPFATGFPKLGARAILEVFLARMQRVEGYEEVHFRVDVLRPVSTGCAGLG